MRNNIVVSLSLLFSMPYTAKCRIICCCCCLLFEFCFWYFFFFVDIWKWYVIFGFWTHIFCNWSLSLVALLCAVIRHGSSVSVLFFRRWSAKYVPRQCVPTMKQQTHDWNAIFRFSFYFFPVVAVVGRDRAFRNGIVQINLLSLFAEGIFFAWQSLLHPWQAPENIGK